MTARLAGAAAGQQDPWVMWSGEEVVGRALLTKIVRGVFQSASLGYWVDHRHTRRGIATVAVRTALQRATEIGLHRVEAGTLPYNEASQRVLRRCGFERFGTAKECVFIAGVGQGHVMFQKILHTRPVWSAPGKPTPELGGRSPVVGRVATSDPRRAVPSVGT